MFIVGPCSAETRQQLLLTARLIHDACGAYAFVFRAGAWKPRTDPSSFQGIGTEALQWLDEARQTYGMPVATEVATTGHLHAALQAGIDYLWIGARTSANPIAVQELADALAQYATQSSPDRTMPKAVLVKNPTSDDVPLWLGNIARIEATGVPVIAVHRGCGHKPCWRMAHALRTARPDIPLLIDPSHMSGDAAQIKPLLDKAMELGYDGAMIEVHAHPEDALSDAKQQITPEGLDRLHLTEYTPAATDRTPTESVELNWWRAEIDELDDRLWDTIARRMEVSRAIGEWKKANGVAPLQPDRYQQIVERLKAKGEKMKDSGLTTDFMLKVWETIHEESLRKQIEN